MTSSYADHARERKMADAFACGIDGAFISQLVASFCEAIRQDGRPSPILTSKISDWPRHLARMKMQIDFYREHLILADGVRHG